MSNGFIVQIIGAVVDIEFPQDAVPQVYDALKVVSEGQGQGLVLEVQQQIGGGVVRCITMGSSDGLRRGLEVVNSGKSIQVPVGVSTLGRIMNVLGDPIDEKVRLVKKSVGPSTARLPATKISPTATTCWRPASRLSTWYARSPRVVRLVCSVVPV